MTRRQSLYVNIRNYGLDGYRSIYLLIVGNERHITEGKHLIIGWHHRRPNVMIMLCVSGVQVSVTILSLTFFVPSNSSRMLSGFALQMD
ncbi:hypothetical protein M5689_011607 [Euphorbia peplus]|nr:hypothetical protein M5689_011607 [Euphorbia peplus]